MKVLLADDHVLVREGMKLLFEKLDPGAEVLEAQSYEQTVAVAREASALDLILLDLKMPGMQGVDSLVALREEISGVPVVILSGAFDRQDVLAALDQGAAGFIPKTLGSEAMFHAINLVLSGEKFVPSLVYFEDGGDGDGADAGENDSLFTTLTSREREVLELLIQGNSNNQMADSLGLQEVTVRARLTGVFRKLGVKNRTQAVGLAMRKGFGS
jgi:two-component system, NarL family, nitrate/nitrite response regulator NarL